MSQRKKARVFSREFKLRAVERMLAGEGPSALARELQLRRKLLYEWKDAYSVGGVEGLRTRGRPRKGQVRGLPPAARTERAELLQARKRIAELERIVGRQQLENDFFAEALRREGWAANHKRVLRLLRTDNLLCLGRRAFVRPATDSKHPWPVWPNLVRGIRTTGLNQLWVADITYVRLREEFVYLAVVLDAHSRRVVGWAMERYLSTILALRALKMALAERNPMPGMIHHSDRGIQYACSDYVGVLQQRGIQISMSRVGNPYDDAKAESFMKTLKQEEVDGSGYRDLNHMRRSIAEFVENVYNRQRLHSALGYLSPVEFEEALSLARGSTGMCGGRVLLPPSPTPPTPATYNYSVPGFPVS